MVADKAGFEAGHWRPLPGGLEFADDYVSGFAQAGTHCDALGHMWFDDTLWNGYPAASTNGGMTKAGIEPIARRGIVGRAVLLDLTRFRGKSFLQRVETFDHRDLLECSRAQEVEIKPRSILMLRTGWLGALKRGEVEIDDKYWEPGLTFSLELVRWFHEIRIPCFLTDTLANETTYEPHSGLMLVLHAALMRNLAVVFIEMAWLTNSRPTARKIGSTTVFTRLSRAGEPRHWRRAQPHFHQMTHASSEVVMSTASPIDLCFLPATELAARIRRRDISPVEAVESYLRRIEERIPQSTLIRWCSPSRLGTPRTPPKPPSCRGALWGHCTACPSQSRTSTTSPECRRPWDRSLWKIASPRRARRLSRGLLDAGAIVLGKTNTPEFGHKGITDNLRFGPTSTPWKIGYNSGGSSGGSAAAVADGMAALGQGTDGGGSVDPGRLQRRRRFQAFLRSCPLQ